MVVRGLAVLGLVGLACSSPASATGDAGPADAAGAEGASCSSPDVFCGGLCQPQSVSACGASCKQCAQPAESHGQSQCLDGMCQFECALGYVPCGSESCCGDMTRGDVKQMAVGGETTCAVTTAGLIGCWGDDSYGVLGDGNTSGVSVMPVQVVNLPSTAQHVAIGGHHACALLSGGLVACWGNDEQGQLGDGQRTPRGTPVKPSGLASGVSRIAVGGAHSCAVAQGGSLFCWGDNTSGQLGNPMAASSSTTPIVVAGLSGVVDVAAGLAFTCALLTAGQVQCWGDGTYGQLGGPAKSTTPVEVSMPMPAKAIAAGSKHVCAITTAGSVLCWGADDVNQLGSGSSATEAKPLSVPKVSGALTLTAGDQETCALDGAGAVRCWGSDPVGDVGIGPAGPALVPSLSSGVAEVGAVSGHACAVTVGGAPKCWGTNGSGDLGDGTMVPSWVPIDVGGI